jgi:hypothetical protein
MNTPATDTPILVGIMVDVSGSMTSSIRNARTSQNRLESFRDALEGLVRNYANTIERESRPGQGRVSIFAYGFGFGNPLSQLLGRKIPSVHDLFELPGEAASTVDIVHLAKQWPRYRSHVEGLATQMFGDTPMGEGFRTARERFSRESAPPGVARILFVLSDGEPTDCSAQEIVGIASELKAAGVFVVSCFVTGADVAEPRHIYGTAPRDWPDAAKLMFECASVIPNGSPFYFYLKEYGWKLDEGGRLFTQVNQSELLAEFMNVILSPVATEGQGAASSPTSRLQPVSPQSISSPEPTMRENTPGAPVEGKEAVGPLRNDASRREPGALGAKNPTGSTHVNWPAWVFGGLLVLFFMAIVWFKPQVQFSDQQQKLLRILASVLVGVISGLFTGALRLEGKIPVMNDVQIAAAGGFAGFALTFFLW